MTISIKRARSRTGWLRAALACTTAAAGLTAPATSRAEIAAGTALRVELSPRTVARTERASVHGERFASGPNETFEILLSDGGSIVLGPSSAVLVSDYTFDPATGSGSFSAQLEAGSVRMMGGQLNRAAPMELVTPGGRLSLANGGAFVTTESGGTRASLLAGTLAMTTDRGDVRIEKPGFEAVIADGDVSAPRRQSRGRAFADAAVINPGLRTGGMARLVKVAESDVDAEAEQTPQTDNQLVRSQVDAKQPTGSLEFGGPGRTITLPGGEVITIFGASAGTVPPQENPSLGDGDVDLYLAQNLETTPQNSICYNCPRSVGIASNRFLSSYSFDYNLSNKSPLSLTRNAIGSQNDTYESEDLSYLFSSGLTETALTFFEIEVNINPSEKHNYPDFITFDGEKYDNIFGSDIFRNSDGDEIIYNSTRDYFYIEALPFSAQSLLILTGRPEDATPTDASGGGVALTLPMLKFPKDGGISISTYSGPVFAKTVLDDDDLIKIDEQELNLITYEDHANYIRNATNIKNINTNINILQSGFGIGSGNAGPTEERKTNNFFT